MPAMVTKEPLNVLANAALSSILIEAPAKTEYNLNDFGASGALGELLDERYGVGINGNEFAEGYIEGVELGIAIAAAVASAPLDLPTASEAVNAEVRAAVDQLRARLQPRGAE